MTRSQSIFGGLSIGMVAAAIVWGHGDLREISGVLISITLALLSISCRKAN